MAWGRWAFNGVDMADDWKRVTSYQMTLDVCPHSGRAGNTPRL